MRRIVAIGSNSKHDYNFFLPFVGVLWRDIIGYEPVFFLVDKADWDSTPHGPVAVAGLRSVGFEPVFVDGIEGVESATSAQSIRLYAAALPDIGADDLIIPADADLFPLRRDFYHQHDPDEHPIASYYANGYGEDQVGKHFPSNHVSARAGVWRHMMRIEDGDSPREAMARNFRRRGLSLRIEAKKRDPAKEWGHVWFEDEFALSEAILGSGHWPQGVKLIRREGQPPVDRLDRACWPQRYDVSRFTDCHSIRPGWSDPNWPRFRPLLEQTIPRRLAWADAYRTKFRQAMGVPQ